jgi:protein arginine kinase
MDLTRLKDRPVEWLKGGPEDDVVVSSRVRLARNIDGFPFVGKASARQTARVEELLREVLPSLAFEPRLEYVSLHDRPALQRELLVERRLISREHAEADHVRGVAFDGSEQFAVMVNEEDHLRLQSMRGGLRLREVFDGAEQLDDVIGSRVPFAFSGKYGFLTACPSNAGTGMRASVMLHLPGLVMAQEMDSVIALAREKQLTLRGVYGEGSYGAGDFYQVSNHVTLGVTEESVVESVGEAARDLAAMERRARRNLHDKHLEEFRNRIDRALRLLRSAGTISSHESLSLISQVRMGVEMDMVEGAGASVLNDLLLLTLPAHLQTMAGRELDSSVRNAVRADFVKHRLSTG